MRLYVIAGEASGDLHGAALLEEILNRDLNTEIAFWGGDEMSAIAGTPRKHIRDLAFMGFVEVIRHLPAILGNFRFCKKDIEAFKPDAVVLIDYPGFNLRMAKWLRSKGIKVIYYISPQLWAWHSSRVKQIRKNVDIMLCILPFEKAFYASYNVDVHYIGHPLAERLLSLKRDTAFRDSHGLDQRPIIALLPGSRTQEITSVLPEMIKASVDPEFQYVIAAAPNRSIEFYQPFIGSANIRVVTGATYQLLLNAHMAIVTSGTATLETALLGIPQVVCYKGSWMSYQIARRVINVKYISLVNLILDQPLVPELIQGELNRDSLISELNALKQGDARNAQLEGYDELKHLLGDEKASRNAADIIIGALT